MKPAILTKTINFTTVHLFTGKNVIIYYNILEIYKKFNNFNNCKVVIFIRL